MCLLSALLYLDWHFWKLEVKPNPTYLGIFNLLSWLPIGLGLWVTIWSILFVILFCVLTFKLFSCYLSSLWKIANLIDECLPNVSNWYLIPTSLTKSPYLNPPLWPIRSCSNVAFQLLPTPKASLTLKEDVQSWHDEEKYTKWMKSMQKKYLAIYEWSTPPNRDLIKKWKSRPKLKWSHLCYGQNGDGQHKLIQET